MKPGKGNHCRASTPCFYYIRVRKKVNRILQVINFSGWVLFGYYFGYYSYRSTQMIRKTYTTKTFIYQRLQKIGKLRKTGLQRLRL